MEQFESGERNAFMATEILSHLRSDIRHSQMFLPPPFFLEFTGQPDSGKSSAIKSLYIFLRRHGFRIKKPLEGAEEISDDIPRSSPEFNLATGAYAVKFLTYLHHMHTHDVVMLDRGIIDAYMQMKSWRMKGKLTEREMRSYQEYFTSRFWASRLTNCYILTCDPEVSIARTQREARTDKLGGSTTPESIALMRKASIETYEELKDRFPLTLVDTSKFTIEEAADHINALVLERLVVATRERKQHS